MHIEELFGIEINYDDNGIDIDDIIEKLNSINKDDIKDIIENNCNYADSERAIRYTVESLFHKVSHWSIDDKDRKDFLANIGMPLNDGVDFNDVDFSCCIYFLLKAIINILKHNVDTITKNITEIIEGTFLEPDTLISELESFLDEKHLKEKHFMFDLGVRIDKSLAHPDYSTHRKYFLGLLGIPLFGNRDQKYMVELAESTINFLSEKGAIGTGGNSLSARFNGTRKFLEELEKANKSNNDKACLTAVRNNKNQIAWELLQVLKDEVRTKKSYKAIYRTIVQVLKLKKVGATTNGFDCEAIYYATKKDKEQKRKKRAYTIYTIFGKNLKKSDVREEHCNLIADEVVNEFIKGSCESPISQFPQKKLIKIVDNTNSEKRADDQFNWETLLGVIQFFYEKLEEHLGRRDFAITVKVCAYYVFKHYSYCLSQETQSIDAPSEVEEGSGDPINPINDSIEGLQLRIDLDSVVWGNEIDKCLHIAAKNIIQEAECKQKCDIYREKMEKRQCIPCIDLVSKKVFFCNVLCELPPKVLKEKLELDIDKIYKITQNTRKDKIRTALFVSPCCVDRYIGDSCVTLSSVLFNEGQSEEKRDIYSRFLQCIKVSLCSGVE